MRILFVIALCGSLLGPAELAAADDGDPRFRKTTPRGALATSGPALVIGVPGGRAWGIESELRPLPPRDTVLYVRVTVADPLVREAFVRVAYYGAPSGRTRQLAVTDGAPVRAGTHMLVAVALDPPPGAVAFRMRVLARLTDPTGRSAEDAVVAVLHPTDGRSRPVGSLTSRLLP